MSVRGASSKGQLDKRVLSAATLASAPAEVLDFLLPLWAGSELNAGAAVIGALITVESVLSLLVRPLAGHASDRFDPRLVASAGALLYAAAFAGYALAEAQPVAFAAAALGGAGGALFWVGLRTWVGFRTTTEGGEPRSSGYGKLLRAEGEGAFVGYLIAFTLLGRGGYETLFWVGAAACVAAAVLLALNGERTSVARHSEVERPRGQRRLLPLMSVSALTAAAEAGVWMLLLLRLQEELGMQPGEIAMVFAPGFVVFILVPEHAHHVTERLGRTRTMVIAFVAATLFAGGLAVAATPVVIACLWGLAAACYAAQIPVEQATIAAASEGGVGRAMGRYESARLVGVMLGPLLMGGLYQVAGWAAACGLAAVLSLVGAVCVPYALRATGLPESVASDSGPVAASCDSSDAGPRPPWALDISEAAASPDPTSTQERKEEIPVDLRKRAPGEGVSAEDRAKREREGWYIHTAVFLAVQLALLAFDQNWAYWELTEGDVPEEHGGWATTAGRIWIIVWVIDTVVSWSYTFWPRAKEPSS